MFREPFYHFASLLGQYIMVASSVYFLMSFCYYWQLHGQFWFLVVVGTEDTLKSRKYSEINEESDDWSYWPYIFCSGLFFPINSWLLATLTYGYRLRLWLLNPTFWKLIMLYIACVQLWSATCTVPWGVKVSIRGVYNQRVSNRILTIYLSIVVSELKFPTSYEGPRSNTLSFVTYMMWINRKDHNLNNANF